MSNTYDLIVIGGGPAGVTAALRARELPGGALSKNTSARFPRRRQNSCNISTSCISSSIASSLRPGTLGIRLCPSIIYGIALILVVKFKGVNPLQRGEGVVPPGVNLCYHFIQRRKPHETVETRPVAQSRR